jgi:hypothetical protein
MSTFYKYAERNADSYIDWAEVGKDVTTMLSDENKRREDEKAELDRVTKESFDALANGPQGEHEGINQWWLDYADNGSKYLKLQDDLLKSGRLKVRDFVKNRQNLMDGTDQATKLVKSYQDEWADKMAREKDDKNQYLETWATASVEGFADFSRSRLYINPATGAVSVAMMTKKNVDGKDIYTMDDNPTSFMTVNEMQGRIKAKFDKFDVDNALDQYVGSLGENIQLIEDIAKTTGAKTISSVLDPTSKSYNDVAFNFVKAETDALTSLMANPYNISSIMTENIKGKGGKAYDFTQSEDEAKRDKTKIFVYTDPKSGMVTPRPTDEQKADVLEWLRSQARLRYDKKMKVEDVKYKAEYPPIPMQQWQWEAAQENQKLATAANYLSKLYNGTDAEVKSAVDFFNGFSTTSKMSRDKDGISITYADGRTKDISFKTGDKGDKLKTLEDFAVSAAPALLGDNVNITDIKRGLVPTKGISFNQNASYTSTTTPKEDPNTTYGNIVSTKLSGTKQAIKNTEENAIRNLGSIYGDLGFIFESDNKDGKSQITVTAPNKKSATFNVNLSDNDADKSSKIINSFIKANGTKESIQRSIDLTGGGIDYSGK